MSKAWVKAAPALTPKIVTLSGSPPKLAIFSLTHSNAAIISFNPWFPGATLWPRFRNPSNTSKIKSINWLINSYSLIGSFVFFFLFFFLCTKFSFEKLKKEKKVQWWQREIIPKLRFIRSDKWINNTKLTECSEPVVSRDDDNVFREQIIRSEVLKAWGAYCECTIMNPEHDWFLWLSKGVSVDV